MKVRFTAEAKQDIGAIGDFIALDNPLRAFEFVTELRAKCLDLENFPKRFPLVPRIIQAGIRKRTYGNYLIFYRIDASCVTVLHVLNGAMDYLPLLEGE